MTKRVYRRVLLGMGFDGKDGHVRLTKGDNFRLVGGSEKTHDRMQEAAVKFNGELGKRRKTLDDISDKEFCDIARSVGLKVEEGDLEK